MEIEKDLEEGEEVVVVEEEEEVVVVVVVAVVEEGCLRSQPIVICQPSWAT